uniref:Transmembrane protein n=1 Tax=Chromera velia CCMP2878 TaxID=1169474 RepID=A0A0G4HXA6_9ALVE|eukprot:Cvel_9247.t1-p1 / transcript=Cvel_9247.t1 / gene=Cvel_9247 / organism=Chromera_velia_CCMP2878 / gene_product=hypothetical protein / transcript_product=hypothetical protein / location=Cvel_scaffold528:42883-58394(-) / protein_length=740 / sequence_SO=supercontig / SO=protein_coding / is_pseudo=false
MRCRMAVKENGRLDATSFSDSEARVQTPHLTLTRHHPFEEVGSSLSSYAWSSTISQSFAGSKETFWDFFRGLRLLMFFAITSSTTFFFGTTILVSVVSCWSLPLPRRPPMECTCPAAVSIRGGKRRKEYENEKGGSILYEKSHTTRKSRGDLPKLWVKGETCSCFTDEKIKTAMDAGHTKACKLINKLDTSIWTNLGSKVKVTISGGGPRGGNRKQPLDHTNLLSYNGWSALVNLQKVGCVDLKDDDDVIKVVDSSVRSNSESGVTQEGIQLSSSSSAAASSLEGNSESEEEEEEMRGAAAVLEANINIFRGENALYEQIEMQAAQGKLLSSFLSSAYTFSSFSSSSSSSSSSCCCCCSSSSSSSSSSFSSSASSSSSSVSSSSSFASSTFYSTPLFASSSSSSSFASASSSFLPDERGRRRIGSIGVHSIERKRASGLITEDGWEPQSLKREKRNLSSADFSSSSSAAVSSRVFSSALSPTRVRGDHGEKGYHSSYPFSLMPSSSSSSFSSSSALNSAYSSLPLYPRTEATLGNSTGGGRPVVSGKEKNGGLASLYEKEGLRGSMNERFSLSGVTISPLIAPHPSAHPPPSAGKGGKAGAGGSYPPASSTSFPSSFLSSLSYLAAVEMKTGGLKPPILVPSPTQSDSPPMKSLSFSSDTPGMKRGDDRWPYGEESERERKQGQKSSLKTIILEVKDLGLQLYFVGEVDQVLVESSLVGSGYCLGKGLKATPQTRQATIQ